MDTPISSAVPLAELPTALELESRWLRRLSLPLRAAVVALCLNFVAGILGANFPPRWSDPNWILNLSISVVNGATMPMMALCLLQLVAFLERGLGIQQHLLEWFRHLALWAALGFLLLLPLVGFCSWQVLSRAAAQDTAQAKLAGQAIERVEILGRSDLDPAELKLRLQAIPGVRLPLDFDRRSAPQLKQELNLSVERGRTELIEQQVGRRNQRLLLMSRNWLRIPLSCLAYALAFGAFARRSDTTRPLYEELAELLRRLRLVRLYARLQEEERQWALDEQEADEELETLGRIRPLPAAADGLPGSGPEAGSPFEREPEPER